MNPQSVKSCESEQGGSFGGRGRKRGGERRREGKNKNGGDKLRQVTVSGADSFTARDTCTHSPLAVRSPRGLCRKGTKLSGHSGYSHTDTRRSCPCQKGYTHVQLGHVAAVAWRRSTRLPNRKPVCTGGHMWCKKFFSSLWIVALWLAYFLRFFFCFIEVWHAEFYDILLKVNSALSSLYSWPLNNVEGPGCPAEDPHGASDRPNPALAACLRGLGSRTQAQTRIHGATTFMWNVVEQFLQSARSVPRFPTTDRSDCLQSTVGRTRGWELQG